ncbi:MAG TPA: ubiquinone/menaquinone biosynthesis methyltransferase, partial [Bacteroidia bacterium]|nr:ubiquinone/menaquinone biosynthesis methyltransferase [Bacteroidia bacterium]
GIHKSWRKKAVRMLRKDAPKTILDMATGTGDFAIEALKLNPDRIIGVDISEGMLSYGREKLIRKNLSQKIELRKGDSENLDFPDNTFDALTVGFGVRNFENLEKGLSGMLRVLKPGGRAVILEFSKPRVFPVKQIYFFYFRYITPLVGRIFSKDQRAYSYLNESVEAFPDGKDFIRILEKVGYRECTLHPLSFGIATIYQAIK